MENQNPILSINQALLPEVLASYCYGKLQLLNAARGWREELFSNVLTLTRAEPEEAIAARRAVLDRLLAEGQAAGGAGETRRIADPAHRLAAEWLSNPKAAAVALDQWPDIHVLRDFLARGLNPDIADALALALCRLCPSMVMGVVFPIARGRDRAIELGLETYGQIAFEKEISLSKWGQYNFIRLLYFNMHWIGADHAVSYGVCHHVENRFFKDQPVKLYFLKCNDISQVLEAKMEVRALFDLKNFSVHINDTHEETLWLAEHLLSANSVHFINHAHPWLSKNFLKKIRALHQEINEQGFDQDHLCLCGKATPAAYGLRDTRRLDGLTLDEFPDDLDAVRRVALPLGLAGWGGLAGELVYDPRHNFYYLGLKFVSLNAWQMFFARRHSFGDWYDRMLVASLHGSALNIFKIWRHLRFFIKRSHAKLSHFELRDLKKLIPGFLFPAAKQVYHRLARSAKKHDS